MGLFVADDGHYQGWLAALLCCCAAVDDDEHPIERERERSRLATSAQQSSVRQPTPLNSLPATPYATSQSTTVSATKDDDLIYESDLLRPVSQRPPSLKPLDLGETSLLGRLSPGPWRRSFTGMSSPNQPHSNHSLVGARRPENLEKHRLSLVPLRLSPVVLRQSNPDPTAYEPTDNMRSTDHLVDAIRRGSDEPVKGVPHMRGEQLEATPALSAVSPSIPRTTAPVGHGKPSRPTPLTVSSSSSMSSLRKQALETSALSFVGRPSTEGKRLKRKRSLQTRRKASVDGADAEIDREILELNTIVEERRNEAARLQRSESQHIPAVAPSMPIGVRSETLTSIGSAFSRPATAHSPAPNSARLSRPFIEMPEVVPRPATSHTVVRSSSRSSKRVSGWLSDMMFHKSSNEQSQGSFYKCTVAASRRPESESSLYSVVTETETPALTVASSPTSKGHSRRDTAESRLSPSSPPMAGFGPDGSKAEEPPRWPMIVENPSQVGLAF